MHLTGMKSMTGIKNNENREASVNEKTIHTGRNVRWSGLAAKQHSSTVCAGGAGMFGSVRRCFKIDKALWALCRRTSTAWTA